MTGHRQRGGFHDDKRKPHGEIHGNEPEAQINALSDLAYNLAAGEWTLGTPRIHRCEPAWRWRPPPLPDWDFWLVLEGRGVLRVDSVTHPLQPGRWFLFQPGDRPDGEHDPDAPLVVFACHFRRETDRRLHAGVLTGTFVGLPRGEAEAAVRVAEERPTGRLLATVLLRRIVLQALHESGRVPLPARDRLDALARDIRAAPGNAWPVATLARRCGLSVPHFNRVWRVSRGCSPGRFVILQRILRATQLLRESDLSIQQIADALGYGELTFFHRQFRRFTGTTPRAARHGALSKLDDFPEKL